MWIAERKEPEENEMKDDHHDQEPVNPARSEYII